jgi:hypothetical protein
MATVERLRQLLVGTTPGTVAVSCDLTGCDGDAEQVAVGAAFVCTEPDR